MCRLTLIALLCCFVGFSTYAATPGIPFTEDFSDTSLRNGPNTFGTWSAQEQAAYLSFSSQYKAERGSYDTLTPENFGTGSEVILSIAFGDVDGERATSLALTGTFCRII